MPEHDLETSHVNRRSVPRSRTHYDSGISAEVLEDDRGGPPGRQGVDHPRPPQIARRRRSPSRSQSREEGRRRSRHAMRSRCQQGSHHRDDGRLPDPRDDAHDDDRCAKRSESVARRRVATTRRPQTGPPETAPPANGQIQIWSGTNSLASIVFATDQQWILCALLSTVNSLAEAGNR